MPEAAYEGLWSRWFRPVVGGIVVAAIASVLTYLWTRWDNRLRELEYSVSSSSSIIKTPELGGRLIEVFVDKERAENISTVRVELFNRTDRDFVDIPVRVSFSTTLGDPLRMVQSDVLARSDVPIVNEAMSAPGYSAVEARYIIKVANRSDRPILEAQYAFLTAEAPITDIAIPMQGVTAAPIKPRAGVYPFLIFGPIAFLLGMGTRYFVDRSRSRQRPIVLGANDPAAIASEN